MSTLHFSHIDLEANRAGRLTTVQRKKLEPEIDRLRRYRRNWLLLGLGLFLVFIGVGMYVEYSHPESFPEPFMKGWVFQPEMLCMLGAFVSVGLAPFLIHLQPIIGRYNRGEFFTVDGYVESLTIGLHGCRVTIQRNDTSTPISFPFDNEDGIQYFKIGQHYRVYYWLGSTELSQQPLLLSAEELEGEKAKR